MKFSVLMSVYKNDNANYLEESLKSIYDSQTVKPDEIVIVFDGPLTNDLYKVLNNFRDGKEKIVFYYPQEINRGLGEALKIGTSYCSGDYIFRMDSDDVSDSTRFEKQIEYVMAHPEVDVVGTNIAEFYNSKDEDNKRVRVCPINHSDIVKMCKKRNPMNHVSVCIKKEALIKCGGYENLLLLEDYFLWIKMIASGCTLANINESLVYVRIGNGFHSKRGSKLRIKGWKVLQNYMIKNKMITKRQGHLNMMYIILFTYCPVWLKKIVYKKCLRK